MKRPIYILLILWSNITVLQARDRQTDSLWGALKRTDTSGRLQAALYTQLALKTQRLNVEKAKEYGRKAISIARAGRYKTELAMAYISTGYAYNAAGDTDECLALADSAWQLVKKTNNTEVKFFAQALMGGSRRKRAQYDEALRHYIMASRIAEEKNDKRLIGKAYNMLGVFYVTINDLTRADEYHRKALGIRLQAGDNTDIFESYENLGILNRELKQYDKALQYYFKAAEYARKSSDSSDIAFVYNDIGAAYSLKGDLHNAEKYLMHSITLRTQLNEKEELAYTYNYLGENYERKGDMVRAELNIKKAILIAQETQNNKQTYEAYESLANFFARTQHYDSAYHYVIQYKHFKDSVTKDDQGRIIAALNTRFETAQKERKIREQQFEIAKRNYWIAGISGLLLMGTSIGYGRYRASQLKQRAALQGAILQQQELATKAILEAEENERQRIASDLHDGVGQIMSAAKLNLSSLKAELPFTSPIQERAFDNALTLVDSGCKEVRHVSHNIMPNALLKNGLASAIREFVGKIDYRVIEVNLYSDGLNERIDINIETVLYRVVQECVNNVIRHSEADKLDITLIRDEDGISVTIEDNGKGFDTHNLNEFSGIGIRNIRSRIGYLKGTVEWDASEGKGTVVTIQVP